MRIHTGHTLDTHEAQDEDKEEQHDSVNKYVEGNRHFGLKVLNDSANLKAESFLQFSQILL